MFIYKSSADLIFDSAFFSEVILMGVRPWGKHLLRIKPSTLPFISLTRLVVAAFSSSGAGTALTSSSCQGLQKDVEGAASKGAGRSLPQPKARELSLKRDNRNTRRVLKQHQRDEHLLGVLRQQVLPRPQEGERRRKFFSRTRRRCHTLLEMGERRCNQRTQREAHLDGPSDVYVDVEDGSRLLEEMVGLLQYSLEVVAVVMLGCWLQDTIFLTLSPLGSSASAKRRLPQEKLHPQEHSRHPSCWSQKQH